MNNVKIDYAKYKDVAWRAEESNNESILFYNIREGQESLFYQRIKQCKYGLLITNKEVKVENNLSVKDDQFYKLQIEACDQFYPMPQFNKIIGITGTNGKTTTTFILHQLLQNSLMIGTLGVYTKGRQTRDFNLTSPAYIDLRKALHQFGQDKDFLILEVSSHGLDQKRIQGIELDIAAWTSFSQDHLDTYKTMENYFNSKMQILDIAKNNVWVPESQTELIHKINSAKVKKAIRHSDEYYQSAFLQADYNKDNLDIALSILEELNQNVTFEKLKSLEGPPGRFELIELPTNKVIIDFAHTPDAIENILTGVRESFQQNIVTVFGCGGDRDRSKRPLMAKKAEKYSDQVILTSDNPRFEDIDQILEDTEKGFRKKTYKKIADRKKAIKYAIENYPNCIIVIAGKGHEPYLDIQGVKHPYSDKEVCLEYING
jgi:UDP-N-acetylmuramoyl-L-alanyl-D-glutamate--2,6-diaminopimelate ligase